MSKRLNKEEIIHKSGLRLPGKSIEVIKGHAFKVLDVSVGGDAPKDVVHIYRYDGVMRKNNPKSWPTYIVKIGQKWYPNESITEQLLSDLGICIGVRMAESLLGEMEGMVRFCSKHFHSKQERLDHGAEIVSRYFDETDPQWVDDMDRNNELKKFIDVEGVINIIKTIFKEHHRSILQDFFQMILFDCFVGNNDRHYYNWGVIMHIEEEYPPSFSPIYDTARALWWNYSDKFIVSLCKDKNRQKTTLKKYIEKSLPKITLPGHPKCNHFELIDFLNRKGYLTEIHRQFWLDPNILRKCYNCIDDKYRNLMISERRKLIKNTLASRLFNLQKALKNVE